MDRWKMKLYGSLALPGDLQQHSLPSWDISSSLLKMSISMRFGICYFNNIYVAS